MSLTQIEAYVYGGNCAHFVTAFRSSNREITVEFQPMEGVRADGASNVIAMFADAVMLDCEEIESWNYPLDPVGFDSHPSGVRWTFVLNCDSIEGRWESQWPRLRYEPKVDIQSIFDLGRSGGTNIAENRTQ